MKEEKRGEVGDLGWAYDEGGEEDVELPLPVVLVEIAFTAIEEESILFEHMCRRKGTVRGMVPMPGRPVFVKLCAARGTT